MFRRATLSSLVLLTACAPAAPEPVAPPKAVAATPPAPKAAPKAARWLFEGNAGTATTELDLGEKGVLQIGQRGRRWRLGPDGAIETASVLLSQDLIDVRREGDKLLFLGEDGSVFLTDDVFGAARTTRPGPVEKASYAAGKRAILGVERNGTIHRSADAGATWKTSKLPIGAGDTAIAVVANTRGEALILVHPQRVFHSSDDGETFAPLATPGIGAAALRRDAKGELWLTGALVDKEAKLLAGPPRLEVATGFVELTRPKTTAPAKKKGYSDRKQMVGDRLVTTTEEIDPSSKRKKIELTIEPLGGTAGPAYVLAPSASPLTRVRLAGYENNVVAAVYDPEAEPRGLKLFRTIDDGKNWEPLGMVEGTEAAGFRLLAGPGWIAIGELCGTTPPCAPARVKVGTKDFQPLGVPAGARLLDATFDLAHDRAFVLVSEGKTPALYAGKKDGPLARVAVPLEKMPPYAMAVDRAGVLRLAYPFPWRIEKLGADLKLGAPSYLPFRPEGIALTRDHGYAYTSEQAWETADGGEHWTKVAAGSAGTATCGTIGCVQGSAVRLGWDLPDESKPLIAAAAQPIDEKKEAKPAVVKPPAPLEVACKTTGPWKSHKGQLSPYSYFGFDGDVRFLATIGDYEAVTGITVQRGAAAPTTVQLLSPTPKPNDKQVVRHWTSTEAAGIVLARYSYSTAVAPSSDDGSKKYNPVDVELGWYTAATGKAHKVKLPKVKPFRVGRGGPSALTAIVDGGLLFLTNRGEAPLYFIKDDGKIETMPRPEGVDEFGFSEGVKVGNRIVLMQNRGDDVALVSSADAGKTWSHAIWSIGDHAMLTAVEGQPSLVVGAAGWSGEIGGFISLANLGADPAAKTHLGKAFHPIGANGIVGCDAKTAKGLPFNPERNGEGRELRATIAADGAPIVISTESGWMRVLPDGSHCTAVVSGASDGGEGDHMMFLSPADPGHGWLARRSTDDFKFDARPIACTLP